MAEAASGYAANTPQEMTQVQPPGSDSSDWQAGTSGQSIGGPLVQDHEAQDSAATVNPQAWAAFMAAAAAGQLPGVPPLPGVIPSAQVAGWTPEAENWQRSSPVSWPASNSSADPQPPVANPPSQPPVQPPVQLPPVQVAEAAAQPPAQASTGGASNAAWSQQAATQQAARSQQAAMALWAHQWASHMVQQQQQQQYGWPPAGGGMGSAPPWPEHGDSGAWNEWSDASAWSQSGPSAPAAGEAGHSSEAWPNFVPGAMAYGGQSPPGVATSEAATYTQQSHGGEAQVEGQDGEDDLDAEGKALREDITSAVANVLAGDFDCFAESDSEAEDDSSQTEQPAPSQDRSLPAMRPPAQVPPPLQPPPPPPAVMMPPPQAPPPGPPMQLSSSAFAAAGLMSAQPARAAAPPPAQQPSGPTSEGVQDFLSVLRRRALPAELTEDKRKHVTNMISNCVLSLYRDRIRPVQNNVQRRLRERTCSEAVVQALLPLCAREHETYRILPPTGSRLPVILLLQEPRWFQGFVDTEAAEGYYCAEAWEALTTFLSDDYVSLPSQPYQAAVELRQLNLPHLQSLALGEVEHMVRLSMGKRRLLAFHGDCLKPTRVVHQLDAREKQQKRGGEVKPLGKGDFDEGNSRNGKGAAITHKIDAAQHFTDMAAPYMGPPLLGEITDRDDLTAVLLQLMGRFPDGVSLSLMKQHVQSFCKYSLNESSFKCSKLAEVFKLAPLSTIFPLEQVPNRNEIIVRPPNKNAIPNHIWQKYYYLKEHGGLPPQSAPTGPPPAAYMTSGRGAAAKAAAWAPGSVPAMDD